MDIKPANQKKKLVYPLAAAAVVGSAVLSSCEQQQQQQRLEGEPPQALSGVVMDAPAVLLQVLRVVIMGEPAKGDAPVKADK